MPPSSSLQTAAIPPALRRSGWRAFTVLLALALGAVPNAQSGLLSSVTPMGASTLVTINIVGTGFDPVAAKNEVSFVPAAGPIATAIGTAVLTVDPTKGSRRLTVKIPAGLPVGPTALRVRNLTTGSVSEGRSLDVIAISLPEISSVPAGAINTDIRITGSPNTRFVAGSTQVTFGTGITVNRVTVQSTVTLLANISIPASTAPSVRTVQVTSAQIAVLPGVFTITAPGTSANRNPTANAGGPYSGVAGIEIEFIGSGSDDDLGDILSYGWSFGDAGTGTGATPTHKYAMAGTYTATLTVSDNHGGTATSTAAVAVTAPPPMNLPPAVGAGYAQTITLPGSATLSGTTSDDGLPTGGTLTTEWTKFSGPGAVTFGSAATLGTTATFDQAGTYVLRLTASDSLLTNSADVTITVNPAPPQNQKPVVSAGAAETITLPGTATLTGTASDDGLPTGSVLTTEWTKFSGPGAVTFSSPGTLGTSATFDQAGTYVLRLTASDSLLTNSADVTITVNPAPPQNQKPVVSAGAAETITLPGTATLTGTASDDGLPTGSVLTTAWTKFSGPGAVTFSSPGTLGTSATFDQAGTYVLRLTASDSLLTNSADVAIAVNPAPPENQKPVVGAGTAQTITLPNTATLTGTASDDGLPTGGTLTTEWTKFSGPGAVTFSSPGTLGTSATFDQAGTYVLRLTASDSLLTNSADVTITVNPAPPENQKPVVSAGTAQTITLPNTATLTGTASDDGLPTGSVLTTAWSKFSGPGTVAFSSPGTLGTTATFDQAGIYVLRLTASDSLLSNSADVTITVNPAPAENQMPAVNAGAPQTITLPGTATLTGTASDDGLPTGSVLTTLWTKVSGQGSVAFSSPSTLGTTATFSQAGIYVLRLTASDSLLTNSADVTITVVAAENHKPVAQAGPAQSGDAGTGVTFDGSGSSDPDGDALTYAWSFGDETTSTDRKPFHVYAASGNFTVTLVVTDSRGSASDGATTSATIAAAPDRAPPVVTLSGPKEALPGAKVTMTAEATDNIGVQSVTLDINGADPVQLPSSPYERIVNVPDLVAPGTTLKVGATARDAAGNIGTASATLTVVAEPDTEKPIVSVKAPLQAAPGTVLQVVAAASDNVGIASVILSADSTTIGSPTAAPYEATYVIPLTAVVGSALIVSAQAVDSSNNRATSTASIEIVQTPDATPPTLDLIAPPSAQAGTTVPVSATVADLGGVASVRFFADGIRVATVLDPPYQTSLAVPAGMLPGARLHVEARAVDFSGLEAAGSREIEIVATGQGVLTGEVYDDNSSLPLEGATVALVGNDARGVPYSQSTLSDTHGRYVLHATEGTGTVVIGKSGWSAMDRSVVIKPDTAIEIVDARITAAAAGAAVDALSGGVVTGDRALFLEAWQREVSAAEDPSLGNAALGGPDVTLTIPPGALSSNTTVTLTPLSRQSLPGLLPVGWTPIDIIDVGPHGIALASAATLSSPNALNLQAGTLVTFARWDEQVRGWRALTSSTLAERKGLLTASISSTGQYAWVVADAAPSAPPQPVAGALMTGVAAVLIPQDAAAVVTPQPKILFYKPGVKSTVRGTVTMAGPLLSSGTIIHSKIIEAYQFYSQSKLHLEPVEQDLVLYQIPGGTTPVMAAGFPVSPSLTFEPLTLDKGVITVELRAPEEAVHEIALVGSAGGSIDGAAGERLEVAAGSTPLSVPIEIRSMSVSELGAALPAGFEFVSAASISFASALSAPATFSIPRPAQAGEADIFLLTRLQELGGQTRYVLVDVGKIIEDRLVSNRTLAGTDATFEGVQVPGRYVFLRATNPVAFAAGSVTGVGGTGFAGALVSSSTLALVSVSQSTGRYISGIALGDALLTALDLQKTDTVSALATTSVSLQVVPLNLSLVARPPTVTLVSPANGAVNVALGDPIIVHFSSPIDPATATLQTFQLTSTGGIVFGSLALTSGSTVATFRPVEALQPNVLYTVTVSQDVKDPFGRPLPATFVSAFTSLDTVAPLPPPAGSISATIPGADGKTTITATQGTAGAHDTVVIRNITRGTVTPVVLDPNGGFIVFATAAFTDKLQIVITDASGNQTVAAVPRFHRDNLDGSASEAVSNEGGRVLGPGCTVLSDGSLGGSTCVALDVPVGTFPNGTIITLKPVLEADFPVQLTAEQKQVFSYTGGFQLDLGGQAPTTYINVSIPAAPGDTQVDRWVVGQVLTIGGEALLNVADTARVIDRRITTSSPPCPGVTGSGVYGFMKSARPMGVTFTQMANHSEFVNNLIMVGETFSQVADTFQLPYLTALDATFQTILGTIPRQVCLPVLSGRVTIGTNRFTVPIPAALLTANDEEVVVTNTAPGRESKSRAYPPFEGSVSIDGSETDPIAIEVHSRALVGGVLTDVTRTLGSSDCVQHSLSPDCTKAAPRSFVVIEIPRTEFMLDPTGTAGADQSVLVQNTRTKARATVAFNGRRPFTNVRLIVEGRLADIYTSQIVGGDGHTRTAASLPPVAYTFGSGNLLLRAIPGAIDPTKAQIVEYNANRLPPEPALDERAGVTRVTLRTERLNASNQYAIIATDVILNVSAGDTNRVVTGGFVHALNGILSDRFVVRVEYENGRVDEQVLPSFRVTVKDTNTQAIRKQLVGPAPAPDDTLVLNVYGPGNLEPNLITDISRFVDFDPSRAITLAFSAPLLSTNAFHFAVYDSTTGQQITGKIQLSQRDQVLTFVPDKPLQLDSVYRVKLIGLTDLLGGPLGPLVPPSFNLTTFTPRKLSTFKLLNALGVPVPFSDLAVSHPIGPTGKPQTILTAVPAVRGVAPANTIDVTDPVNPVKLGQASNFVIPKRVTVRSGTSVNVRKLPSGLPVPVPGCMDHIPAGTKFTGDIAVVSTATTAATHISFFDVTDPTKPCALGGKIVTANSEQVSATTRRGTVRGMGVARGVATIEHTTGLAAYMAVTEIGVLAVDVGKNVPEVNFEVREAEGLYSGDYRDVVAIGGRLFAANNAFGAPASLDVLDPNLSFITSVGLNVKPRRLVAAEAVPVDRNSNGQITVDEIFDLVFASGIGGIDIVDVTDPGAPALIGHVNAPGIIRELAVANGGKKLFGGGDRGTVAGEGFFIFDVSNPFSSNGERKVYELAYPQGIAGIQSDDGRGLAYVAHSKGIDVLSVDPPNLSGVIKYTSHPASIDMVGSPPEMAPVLELNREQLLPLRGAVVELKDATNAVIATTNTTDEGYYAFSAPRNTVVTVVVKAALGDAKHPRVTVRDNENTFCLIFSADPDCDVYTTQFSVVVGAAPVARDFTIPSGVDIATQQYVGKREAAPFAIIDTIRDAEKFVGDAVGAVTLPPLLVYWSITNNVSDVGFDEQTRSIKLNGLPFVDTDEYDVAVILHEWAHYFHAVAARDDSTKGSHGIAKNLVAHLGAVSDVLEPSIAFSEGFADAFASMVLQSRGSGTLLIQTGDAKHSLLFDPDSDSVPLSERREACTRPDPDVPSVPCTPIHIEGTSSIAGFPTSGESMPFDGFYSESAVAELLYRLNDSLGFKALYRALAATSTAPAFTSIFSLLHELKAQNPFAVSLITSLAAAQNIQTGNAYGGTLQSLYSTIPLGAALVETDTSDAFGGQPLQTRHTFGPISGANYGNKLLNTALLKFHVDTSERGCYLIEVRPAATSVLFKVELSAPKASALGVIQTQLFRFLESGDYSVRVGGGAPSRFGVRVQRLSLAPADCHP